LSDEAGRAGPEQVGPKKERSVLIKISVRHGQLNDPTRQQIRDKAEKLLHFFDRLTMIEVTVDLNRKEQKWVEILVQAEHKHDFVAHESSPDVLAAVEMVLAKLEGQLRRYKEKIQDHRRTPSTGRVAGAPALEEPGEE
jgi:putative sigma-54 modulation protein